MRAVTQPRALETRERIIWTAVGLFALKGFHDTKLEEIQRKAEVSSGAFFHHFQSKDDLGFAVIDRHMEKRRQLLDQIEQALPPSREVGPLTPVFRRLDAIAKMLKHRQHTKGGCIIGNLSTALCPATTGMESMKFSEWLGRRDEGFVLSDRPPLKGMPRINAFPGIDGRRKRLQVKPVKLPKLFTPIVRKVREIVPNMLVAKIKPSPAATRPASSSRWRGPPA